MAFFDKLNHYANTATQKASGAIEIGKLSLKGSAEEKKISEATVKIGECLLRSLDAGQSYDEAIMSLYEDIVASRAAIRAIKTEIALLNGNTLCPNCETENSLKNKFCKECGVKLEQEPPIVAEVVEPERLCPSCGTPLVEDEHFCTQCGTKMNTEE